MILARAPPRRYLRGVGIRVALGVDHAGLPVKEAVRRALVGLGAEVLDMGTDSEAPCDYPDVARSVAEAVASGRAEKGVLACGSGNGMAIVANRTRGVRAALCPDAEWARLARAHNDANILVLAGRRTPPDRASEIVRVFWETPFDGGRHERRVAKIDG